MTRFIITEWTVNPEEKDIGGLEVGRLSMAIVDNAEDASTQFELAAQDCGVDGDKSMEISDTILSIGAVGMPEDGYTLDNDEGHYINIQKIPEEKKKQRRSERHSHGD